jgi:hypothetical protein
VRWGVELWLTGLAVASLWRALVLVQVSELLAELEAKLTPGALAVVVVLFVVVGLGLGASAWGVARRQEWGRRAARICIVAYLSVMQGYVWLFAQTGQLWARRWVLLALAVVAAGVGIGGLTWHRSRRWLGLV